jgi:hypothetical protein
VDCWVAATERGEAGGGDALEELVVVVDVVDEEAVAAVGEVVADAGFGDVEVVVFGWGSGLGEGGEGEKREQEEADQAHGVLREVMDDLTYRAKGFMWRAACAANHGRTPVPPVHGLVARATCQPATRRAMSSV